MKDIDKKDPPDVSGGIALNDGCIPPFPDPLADPSTPIGPLPDPAPDLF